MSGLPEGLQEFLANAGWGEGRVDPIAGDASFRRYFRITDGDRKAMLMHAPPPEEDPGPFLHVGRWLTDCGHRAPQVYAEDSVNGWILLEDFGQDRMRDWLDDNPGGEEGAYCTAIDALVELHRCKPGPFGPYDMATYQREAALFIEWYCPAIGLSVDEKGYHAAWDRVLSPLLDRQRPGVTVLRDYHAENIMLLDPLADGTGEQGLIDFQDALIGHRAYDLVSLLQDARRDVSSGLERRMLDRYLAKTGEDNVFEADYARLGAQRNAKIVGIFSRLRKRDNKQRYLAFIPRVWEAMERDLKHEALGPVTAWFDSNIPREIRDAYGGDIQ